MALSREVRNLDMRPSAFFADTIDTTKRDAKITCDGFQFISIFPSHTNYLYFFLVEYCERMLDTFNVAITTFAASILIIIMTGSEKKMIWIYTRRVVTMMKHTKAAGETTISKFISNTVGKSAAAAPKHAIPKLIFCGQPFPAILWTFLVHFCPKPIFVWNWRPCRIMSAHILPLLAFDYMDSSACLGSSVCSLSTSTVAETKAKWPIGSRIIGKHWNHLSSGPVGVDAPRQANCLGNCSEKQVGKRGYSNVS